MSEVSELWEEGDELTDEIDGLLCDAELTLAQRYVVLSELIAYTLAVQIYDGPLEEERPNAEDNKAIDAVLAQMVAYVKARMPAYIVAADVGRSLRNGEYH